MGSRRLSRGGSDSCGSGASTGKALDGPGTPARGVFVGAAPGVKALDASLAPPSGGGDGQVRRVQDQAAPSRPWGTPPPSTLLVKTVPRASCAASIVVFAVTAGFVTGMPLRQDDLPAGAALPDARRLALDVVLAAEDAVGFECCDTSIFLMFFRMEAPYRMPYLPQMPTFFVRLPILATSSSCCVGAGGGGGQRAGAAQRRTRAARLALAVASPPWFVDLRRARSAAQGWASGSDAGCPGWRWRAPQTAAVRRSRFVTKSLIEQWAARTATRWEQSPPLSTREPLVARQCEQDAVRHGLARVCQPSAFGDCTLVTLTRIATRSGTLLSHTWSCKLAWAVGHSLTRPAPKTRDPGNAGQKGSPKSHRCRTAARSRAIAAARAIRLFVRRNRGSGMVFDAPPVAAPQAADDEWVKCHDAATGASYYANRRSFEVSWTPPPAPDAAAGAGVAARRRQWSPPRSRWPPRRRHARGAPPTRPGSAAAPRRWPRLRPARSRRPSFAARAASPPTPEPPPPAPEAVAGPRGAADAGAALRGVRRRRRAHRQRHRGGRRARVLRGVRGDRVVVVAPEPSGPPTPKARPRTESLPPRLRLRRPSRRQNHGQTTRGLRLTRPRNSPPEPPAPLPRRRPRGGRRRRAPRRAGGEFAAAGGPSTAKGYRRRRGRGRSWTRAARRRARPRASRLRGGAKLRHTRPCMRWVRLRATSSAGDPRAAGPSSRLRPTRARGFVTTHGSSRAPAGG